MKRMNEKIDEMNEWKDRLKLMNKKMKLNEWKDRWKDWMKR